MPVLAPAPRRRSTALPSIALAAILLAGAALPASAQLTAFRQAVAESAASDEDLSAFYRGRDFQGLWTGADDAAVARRNALLTAFALSDVHALPDGLYDADSLLARLAAADTPAEAGAMDVELSRLFLSYAADVGTGILTPSEVDSHNKREVALADPLALLEGLSAAEVPLAFLQDLAPDSAEYARLLAAKLRLESLIAAGGWGPQLAAGRLEPGATGSAVVALRNRLTAMGYLAPSVTASYDAAITEAVRAFQAGHGLTADGIAGESTIAEINIPAERRLEQVIVAMERERWLGDDRGERHIWVNLVDFTAKIIDHDIVTFQTRSVIGAQSGDRQSPEFSDQMEYMVINPSWYVPRSIIVNEYLPQLQRNAGAAGHLRITDSNGRVVDRGSVNFSNYNARNFPFAMHQPPSTSNALGLVKFMFPNPWNIYLHDTPAQDLFTREVRAFSHGCIRLDDPFDFAYVLLAPQEADPEGYFHDILDTGAETRVTLDQPVPVHLDYRTAFTDVTGGLEFRRDVYGRDALIWEALVAEGVEAPGVQG